MWWLITIIIGAVLVAVWPKQMGVVFGIGLLGVLSFLYFEDQAIKQLNQERDAVDVSVEYDPENCTPAAPLIVIIKNNSQRVVEKVSWNLSAQRKGYTENVVDHDIWNDENRTPYFSNTRLQPDETNDLCYEPPKVKKLYDPSELIWSVTQKTIIFAAEN